MQIPILPLLGVDHDASAIYDEKRKVIRVAYQTGKLGEMLTALHGGRVVQIQGRNFKEWVLTGSKAVTLSKLARWWGAF